MMRFGAVVVVAALVGGSWTPARGAERGSQSQAEGQVRLDADLQRLRLELSREARVTAARSRGSNAAVGALVGALVLGALGAVMGDAFCHVAAEAGDSCEGFQFDLAFTLIGAGVGAAIGAGIGGLVPPSRREPMTQGRFRWELTASCPPSGRGVGVGIRLAF